MLDSVRRLEVGHQGIREQRVRCLACRIERRPLCSWLMPAYTIGLASCSSPNLLIELFGSTAYACHFSVKDKTCKLRGEDPGF